MSWLPDTIPSHRVAAAVERVTLSADQMTVVLTDEARSSGEGAAPIRLAFHASRRQGALLIGSPNGGNPSTAKIDRTLVRAVVQAKAWVRELEVGAISTVRDLARRHQICRRYASRLLPLAYLAPDLTAAILEGRQPRRLTLSALTAQPLPLDWDAQRRLVRSLM